MSEHLRFCPHCGGDLENFAAPIKRGNFEYRPGDGAYGNGNRLRGEPRMHDLIGLLMSTSSIVPRAVVAEKLKFAGALTSPAISVYLGRAKKAAREAGVELPIETIRNRGLRWID